jgi:hypothetical protein
MTITPFGLIFAMLGFTLLVARRAWLLPLLIVSAVLHAFAVVIIGPATSNVGLGVTPWLFTSGLIFIHLIAIISHNRRIELGVSRPVKLLFLGWMIFVGWCVLSAFTLPFIFEGTPVHSLSNWVGFDGPLEPLVWNRISAIQAINSIIMGMLLVYVLQLSKDTNTTKRIMSGFIAAVLVSIGISFCQRLELAGMVSEHFDILHQSLNPSYSHGIVSWRTNWPFSEPSYASAWYAGVSMAGLAVYLFANCLWPGIFFFVAGLFGLIISRGATGFAGFALGLVVLITASAVIFCNQKIPLKRTIWRLTLMGVLIGLIAIIYMAKHEKSEGLFETYFPIQSIIEQKISGPSSWRGNSNIDAMTITKSTWGLGGGLGTNRASSYLFSMMSNIGVPGLALFLILLACQSYLIAFNPTTNNTLKALLSGGTIGMFFGMIAGIPDLMFPAWWIWLIAGFGLITSGQHFRPVQSNL